MGYKTEVSDFRAFEYHTDFDTDKKETAIVGIKKQYQNAWVLHLPKTAYGRKVTEVVSKAFSDMPHLREIVFTDNIKKISLRSSLSSSLYKLHLPASVESFEIEWPFCQKHFAFSIDPKNPHYSTDGVCLFNQDKSVLLHIVKGIIEVDTYQIPKETKVIGGPSAFHLGGFSHNVIIPEGVEELQSQAFLYCYCKTHTIELPKSIKKIGNHCFSNFQCFFSDIVYHGTKAEWEKVQIDEQYYHWNFDEDGLAPDEQGLPVDENGYTGVPEVDAQGEDIYFDITVHCLDGDVPYKPSLAGSLSNG